MPIVKITGQGLSAIALSVAVLWGCWVGERVIRRNADAERVQVMRDLERLQRTHPQREPVSSPLPRRFAPTPTAAG